jgi:hypothetical protein
VAVSLTSFYLVSLAGGQYGTEFNYSQVASFPGGKLAPLSLKAPHPLKYQKWYPAFGFYLSIISKEICNMTLLAYEGSLSAREELPRVSNYCGVRLSCMLSTTGEAVKANMAATTMLLGLTPTILAGLGPTIAEVSLLSLRRPILAILISLGTPAIFPSRIGTYDDPCKVYELDTGALVVSKIARPYSGFVSAAECLLAAGAAANVFQVSYDIGVRSVLGWWCEFSYALIFWSLFTDVIHHFSALALRLSLRKAIYQEHRDSLASVKGLWDRFTQFVNREFKLSANNCSFRQLDNTVIGPVGLALNLLAGWFSLIHIAFGTAVFSGVVFIITGDAAVLLSDDSHTRALPPWNITGFTVVFGAFQGYLCI